MGFSVEIIRDRAGWRGRGLLVSYFFTSVQIFE